MTIGVQVFDADHIVKPYIHKHDPPAVVLAGATLVLTLHCEQPQWASNKITVESDFTAMPSPYPFDSFTSTYITVDGNTRVFTVRAAISAKADRLIHNVTWRIAGLTAQYALEITDAL